MKVVVNGIGCNLTGGKLVLNSFIESYQSENKLIAFVPPTIDNASKKDSITVCRLNHKIIGQIFRPVYDLFISIYALVFGSGVVLNLSNYGLPLFNKEIVYVHNPLLVTEKFYQMNSGFSVRYKLFAFRLTLKRATAIIVQTEHMKKTLLSFMSDNGIETKGRLIVFKPYHTIPKRDLIKNINNSNILFFYPSSSFPHKRGDLAINGILNSKKSGKLVITVDKGLFEESEKVEFLGKVEFDEIIKHFNKCDALLFTSEKETLGLPLLEALSLLKPAVLPNLAYAKEIYGDAAVYFDEFKVKNVAKAIDDLITNFELYKQKALERNEVEFSNRISWHAQWKEIFRLFKHE